VKFTLPPRLRGLRGGERLLQPAGQRRVAELLQLLLALHRDHVVTVGRDRLARGDDDGAIIAGDVQRIGHARHDFVIGLRVHRNHHGQHLHQRFDALLRQALAFGRGHAAAGDDTAHDVARIQADVLPPARLQLRVRRHHGVDAGAELHRLHEVQRRQAGRLGAGALEQLAQRIHALIAGQRDVIHRVVPGLDRRDRLLLAAHFVAAAMEQHPVQRGEHVQLAAGRRRRGEQALGGEVCELATAQRGADAAQRADGRLVRRVVRLAHGRIDGLPGAECLAQHQL
jgi:hypothetical protein